MLAENNLKMIAQALQSTGLRVLTADIPENIPRPCFHVMQAGNEMKLYNQGTEIEMKASYKITYFADRKYLSAIQMQIRLMEILGRKIQSEDYVIYPTELSFEIFPLDGVLEAQFSTYNYHQIANGTEESSAQLMQQLAHQETYN